MNPPTSITMQFCATCGRDSREDPLASAHSRREFLVPTADPCPGDVTILTYVLWSVGEPECGG